MRRYLTALMFLFACLTPAYSATVTTKITGGLTESATTIKFITAQFNNVPSPATYKVNIVGYIYRSDIYTSPTADGAINECVTMTAKNENNTVTVSTRVRGKYWNPGWQVSIRWNLPAGTATPTHTPTATRTPTNTYTPTNTFTPTNTLTTNQTGVRVRTTPGAADVLVSAIPQSQVSSLPVSLSIMRRKKTFSSFAVFGDSLSYGSNAQKDTYPSYLSKLSGVAFVNQGVPGASAPQIAAMLGGLTSNVTISGGVIPASGSVTITFDNTPLTAGSPRSWIRGGILGIPGRVDLVGSTYTFTRTSAGGAVTQAGGTPFTVYGMAPKGALYLIDLGTNSRIDPALVLSCAASCVAYIESINADYIIQSIFNDSSEVIGTTNYANVTLVNGTLSTLYQGHYFDSRNYLIDHYNADSAQDVIDHGNDVVPTSLRSDSMHPNDAGYKLWATGLYDFMLANGWHGTNPNVFSQLNEMFDTSLFFGWGTGKTNSGDWNNSFGLNSLMANTTGERNNNIGVYGLHKNTTGSFNENIGMYGLFSNLTGILNCNVGYEGLYASVSDRQTNIGAQGLKSSTSQENTNCGALGLTNLGTGYDNSNLGYQGLVGLTYGTYNAGVGAKCGQNFVRGDWNTFVGTLSGCSAPATAQYRTAIGAGSVCDSDNTVAVGRSSDQVQLPGGLRCAATIVSSTPYTVTYSNSYVYVDALSSAITIQLPAATASGRVLNLKKIDTSGNSVVYKAASGETIDGSAAVTTSTPYAAIGLQDGASTKWWIH